ncbi:MAG: hypothetical protein U5N56_13180 [Candidatus Marinimicrobia bacterium]|nr:hypothetical protein [Candidatus Neomarinimicrobiota bacterium]
MKIYVIAPLLALILLFGCSGEGYIRVTNETPAEIMVSVNNLPTKFWHPVIPRIHIR